MRKTKQKEAVEMAIKAMVGHKTVEEIYQAVMASHPQISLATVYRNVEKLCHDGLIMKLPDAGKAARYDTNPHIHLHGLCAKCHSYCDIPLSHALDLLIREKGEQAHFTVVGYSLLFHGLCATCGAQGGV